jgi:hypothetical protein
MSESPYPLMNNLTRRKVADSQGWLYELRANGEKFAELRKGLRFWSAATTHFELTYALRQYLQTDRVQTLEEALVAVREGLNLYYAAEDDLSECFTDEERQALDRYHKLTRSPEQNPVAALRQELSSLREDLGLLHA